MTKRLLIRYYSILRIPIQTEYVSAKRDDSWAVNTGFQALLMRLFAAREYIGQRPKLGLKETRLLAAYSTSITDAKGSDMMIP